MIGYEDNTSTFLKKTSLFFDTEKIFILLTKLPLIMEFGQNIRRKELFLCQETKGKTEKY
uniref:Uncharacterized protein n=1 Tax=Onchocerca volvulus TaxID=6282 RepID=A0A8R1XZX9_ONCVO